MATKFIDVPFEKEDIQENGIFRGYGSTFGGKPDSYGDIIARGAFSESLIKNGRGGMGVAMLWQHQADQPIGIWRSLQEDSRGLKVEGQLEIDSEFGKRVYSLLKLGALKGLSIGFDLPRGKDGKVAPDAYEEDKKSNTRTLKRIDLWEVSPVTFPANTRARVTGVKSLEEAKTERELENALRELGLSKKQALHVANLCRPSLRDSGEGCVEENLISLKSTIEDAIIAVKGDPMREILESLNFVNNMLQ